MKLVLMVVLLLLFQFPLFICVNRNVKYSHAAAAVELQMQCVKCNKYTIVVCRRMLSVCLGLHEQCVNELGHRRQTEDQIILKKKKQIHSHRTYLRASDTNSIKERKLRLEKIECVRLQLQVSFEHISCVCICI